MCLFKIVTGDFNTGDLGGVLLASVFFGIMFTLAMQFFVRYQMKRIVIELEPDEKLVKEGGANRILNLEGVGGKLVLTNKRLVFKSHKLNVQVHQLSLPLSEIETVEAGKTGFLNNVLMIYQNDGASNKFIVFEPAEWVKAVETKIASA
jgi:hypothetical protein